MNSFKKQLPIAALTLGLTLPLTGLVHANTDHGGHGSHATADAAKPSTLTDGEIKKVDLDNSKVTIKHGEIKHLDMPPMTMVFTAKDKNLLANLKPGDKVKFMVASENGKMIVTALQPAP